MSDLEDFIKSYENKLSPGKRSVLEPYKDEILKNEAAWVYWKTDIAVFGWKEKCKSKPTGIKSIYPFPASKKWI